jgi:hypothetical protein
LVVVHALADVDVRAAGHVDEDAGAGALVVAGARAARAAVDVVESGADIDVRTAGDVHVHAVAGGGFGVSWAVSGGLGAVVDELWEWESGQLGS